MRRLIPWAGLLPAALCAWPAAAADYRWHLDRRELSLGEPLVLTLERPLRGRGPRLSAIDLGGLAADFEINSRSLGHDRQKEDLRLELYPRRSGDIVLALPGSRRPARVRVTEAEVEFRLSAEPARWVLRQPLRLVLEACARTPLVWLRPLPGFVAGLDLQALDDADEPAEPDGRACSSRRWAWAATPALAGEVVVDFGMLQAMRGDGMLRFPTPRLRARVAPVPAWLPAGMAVGRPGVRPGERGPASVGEPFVWRFEVEGAYDAPTLAALLRAQTAGDRRWSRYPPELRRLPPRHAAPVWDVRLHAWPEAPGPLAFPRLRLPWFDPEAGVLRHALLEAEPLPVFDPGRGRRRTAAFAALTVFLLAAAGAAGWFLQGWRLRRRRLVARLLACADARGLRRELIAWPVGASRPATLGAWLERYQEDWEAPGLGAQLARLDERCFGAEAGGDCASLRSEIAACLAAARPKGGFFSARRWR